MVLVNADFSTAYLDTKLLIKERFYLFLLARAMQVINSTIVKQSIL